MSSGGRKNNAGRQGQGNPNGRQPGNSNEKQQGNPDVKQQQQANSSAKKEGNPSVRQQVNPNAKQQGNTNVKQQGSSNTNIKQQESISFKQAQAAEQRKPRPRSSSSSGDKDSCNVCYRRFPETKYHSIGVCDHSICFECSVRMRVLLEQNECPSCRQVLDNVVITHAVNPYKIIQPQLRMFTYIPKYGIYIEDEEIKQAFDELLEFRCYLCDGKNTVFKNFNGLKQHVQREHELFACDLCVENIKHFPKERKFYTRSDLAYHKRKGDKNDTSHRGHPLCQFCDVRFFDPDHLFKHLRRDHYFCHFCDADGYNHYYNTYDDLRVHFRKEHYLCEEENCAQEKFTSVFRSDIDLKAHLTSAHSRLLGKHGTKQARQLDLEFTMRPSEDDRRGRFGRPEHRYNRARDRERVEDQSDEPPPGEPEFQFPVPKPQIDSARDFPTLGEAPVRNGLAATSVTAVREPQPVYPIGAQAQAPRQQQPVQTISSRIAPTWNAKTKLEDDFPVLAGVSESVANMAIKPKAFLTNAHPAAAMGKPKQPQEDFPALPSQTRSWTGVGSTAKKSNPKGNSKKTAPAPELPKPEFNYVPLYTDRSSHNAPKLYTVPQPEPDSPPSPTFRRVSDQNNSVENKKKQMAHQAMMLFTSNNLPSRTNGSSTEPKLPRRPQNTEEDFPSLEPASSSRKPLTPRSKAISRAKPQPPPRKISPPPGFSLITTPRTLEMTTKPPPGFESLSNTQNY